MSAPGTPYGCGIRNEAELVDRVRETIAAYDLFPDTGPVVLAGSGGPDSAAMLHLMRVLAGDFGLEPVVVHVDHALRPDSELDADAVAAQAERAGLPLRLCRVDVARYGASLEGRARTARYEAMEAVAAEMGAVAIVTGHTADDNVETFILNLLRGAGLDGLAGIPPRRGLVARPLLDVWKAETTHLCAAVGMPVVDDPMNDDLTIARNAVRRELLPLLEARYNPQLRAVLARQIARIRDEAAFLDGETPKTWERYDSEVRFDAAALGSLPVALGRRAVRAGLRALQGDRQWGSATDVDAVLRAAREGTGAAMLAGFVVSRTAGVVSVRLPVRETAPGPAVVRVPGEHTLAGWGLHLRSWVEATAPAQWPTGRYLAVLDHGEVGTDLVVRAPEPGEEMQPLGMSGHKPVRDLLAEAGEPPDRRAAAPVLVGSRGPIWLVGHRIADWAKVTATTRRFLWISVEPSDADW